MHKSIELVEICRMMKILFKKYLLSYLVEITFHVAFVWGSRGYFSWIFFFSVMKHTSIDRARQIESNGIDITHGTSCRMNYSQKYFIKPLFYRFFRYVSRICWSIPMFYISLDRAHRIEWNDDIFGSGPNDDENIFMKSRICLFSPMVKVNIVIYIQFILVLF
jgi:hypothetical protein